jgi:hypothetical protein
MSKSDREGILRMQPSGRWTVCRLGQASRWVASWLKVRIVRIRARARRDRLDRQAPEILPNTIDAGTNGAPPRAEGGVFSCHKKHGEAYCAQRSLRVYCPFDLYLSTDCNDGPHQTSTAVGSTRPDRNVCVRWSPWGSGDTRAGPTKPHQARVKVTVAPSQHPSSVWGTHHGHRQVTYCGPVRA